LTKTIRLRYVAGAAFVLALSAAYLSPVVLALRDAKQGTTAAEFAGRIGGVLTRVLLERGYASEIAEREGRLSSGLYNASYYDYFGDHSNILNRFAYVGLVDAVYATASTRDPIGWNGVMETYERVVPRFLTKDKERRSYQHSDWLDWQIGLGQVGLSFSANFGLANEGLATFGILGFLLYPIIFMAPVLWVMTQVSSFRNAYVSSILFLVIFEQGLVEQTSDGFIVMLTRVLPIVSVTIFAIFSFVGLRLQSFNKGAGMAPSA
jgi:hypothetical protein